MVTGVTKQINKPDPQVKINKIFKRKTLINFLPISFNICFGCSIEPSHRGGSFSTYSICFG